MILSGIEPVTFQLVAQGLNQQRQHIAPVQRKYNEFELLCIRNVNMDSRFLVNDQLDAQFFSMYLYKFFTCFEQSRAHHQENKFYQYNIWNVSLCVGGRFVCTVNKI